MPYCPTDAEAGPPLQMTHVAAMALCQIAGSLDRADDPGALAALEQAVAVGSVDAAVFVWMIPEGNQRLWLRSLTARDPRWAAAILGRLMQPCPWLAHAARSTEPIVAYPFDAASTTPDEDEKAGPPSTPAWVVPAPSPNASDAQGLLIMSLPDDSRVELSREMVPLFRALALALADWFQRRDRADLMARAHLTDRDLELLRHQSLGHGSKQIAAALHIDATTVDCRFHRLNVRLGVASRRDAVLLCRRHGLI